MSDNFLRSLLYRFHCMKNTFSCQPILCLRYDNHNSMNDEYGPILQNSCSFIYFFFYLMLFKTEYLMMPALPKSSACDLGHVQDHIPYPEK